MDPNVNGARRTTASLEDRHGSAQMIMLWRRGIMYKHHEESLERLIEYFSDKEEVIAVIFGGSVAKGW